MNAISISASSSSSTATSNANSTDKSNSMTRPPRPIPNSYWATPYLLACEYPWSPYTPFKPKLDKLLKAGVRTFIDLTEPGELKPYAGNCVLLKRAELLGIPTSQIEYHRFPIRDRSLPPSMSLLYSILHTLRDNEQRGRISAVHCRGGIGRTGMVIGCWLVQSGICKDGEEALNVIAREWKSVEKCKRFPCSPETGEQWDYVCNFQAEKVDEQISQLEGHHHELQCARDGIEKRAALISASVESF